MGVMALLRNNKKKALQQVKHLIKANKDLAYSVLTSNVDGWTPVHACALRGSKKLLKTMLQAGIPINCIMGQPEGLPAGCTLLHVAANRTDKKIVDYLLHHGADVNAKDSYGHTALYYAKQADNKDSVRLLMDCGARLEDCNGSIHHHHQHQRHQQHHNPQPQLLSVGDSIRHGRHSRTRLKQKQSGQDAGPQHPHPQQQQQNLQVPHHHKHPTGHTQLKSNQHNNSFTAGVTAPLITTSATANLQPLDAPSTKGFSSSPCLLLPSTSSSGDSSKKFTSSSSSSNIRDTYYDSISDVADVYYDSCSSNNNNNNNNNRSFASDVNRNGSIELHDPDDFVTPQPGTNTFCFRLVHSDHNHNS